MNSLDERFVFIQAFLVILGLNPHLVTFKLSESSKSMDTRVEASITNHLRDHAPGLDKYKAMHKNSM